VSARVPRGGAVNSWPVRIGIMNVDLKRLRGEVKRLKAGRVASPIGKIKTGATEIIRSNFDELERLHREDGATWTEIASGLAAQGVTQGAGQPLTGRRLTALMHNIRTRTEKLKGKAIVLDRTRMWARTTSATLAEGYSFGLGVSVRRPLRPLPTCSVDLWSYPVLGRIEYLEGAGVKQVAETLTAGTTMVVTDFAASDDTRTGPDFTVITEDRATKGKRVRN
jgi:hypothetical protein